MSRGQRDINTYIFRCKASIPSICFSTSPQATGTQCWASAAKISQKAVTPTSEQSHLKVSEESREKLSEAAEVKIHNWYLWALLTSMGQ